MLLGISVSTDTLIVAALVLFCICALLYLFRNFR